MQQKICVYELVPINTSYIPVSISGNIVHFSAIDVETLVKTDNHPVDILRKLIAALFLLLYYPNDRKKGKRMQLEPTTV